MVPKASGVSRTFCQPSNARPTVYNYGVFLMARRAVFQQPWRIANRRLIHESHTQGSVFRDRFFVNAPLRRAAHILP